MKSKDRKTKYTSLNEKLLGRFKDTINYEGRRQEWDVDLMIESEQDN